MKDILIVDDDKDMVTMLKRLFTRKKLYNVYSATSGEKALELINKKRPDVVISDVKMPNMDGLSLLNTIKNIDETISVILITGYGTIEMAVEALKVGAYDFVEKPFDNQRLLHTTEKALERTYLLRENLRLKRYNTEEDINPGGIIGHSPAIMDVLDMVTKVAECDATVLITGESGTGKELVARALHELSPRRNRELVTVNCPAIPESILESELFGHVKGAFTGANQDKKGLFVAANGSTIFLDEIADIPISIQTKLLRTLQEKEIRPLGSTKTISIDVRVIASTNQDLEEKIANGSFREDLFFRLNVVNIKVPPLRDRKEDIPIIATHFLKRYSARYNKKGLNFSPEAVEYLTNNQWKGNVRELENAVKRAVLLAGTPSIKPEDLAATGECTEDIYSDNPIEMMLNKHYNEAKASLLEKFSTQYLANALQRTHGNVSKAAQLSGLERQSFQRLLRKYGVKAEEYRNLQSVSDNKD